MQIIEASDSTKILLPIYQKPGKAIFTYVGIFCLVLILFFALTRGISLDSLIFYGEILLLFSPLLIGGYLMWKNQLVFECKGQTLVKYNTMWLGKKTIELPSDAAYFEYEHKWVSRKIGHVATIYIRHGRSRLKIAEFNNNNSLAQELNHILNKSFSKVLLGGGESPTA